MSSAQFPCHHHGVTPRTRGRVRDELARLCGAKPGLAVLVDEANTLLGATVPFDGACWHTTDPATLIETSVRAIDLPPVDARAAELEYLTDGDYNKFATLARARHHSGVLSEATGGHLERSLRYRELLQPADIRGELRAAFVVDGTCWGSLAVFRTSPADFSSEDRQFVHEIGPTLARGFRAAVVHAVAPDPELRAGPGVILLGEDRRVESVTEPVQTWLAELGFAGDPHHDPLPLALLAVAARARAVAGDASSRVLGASGRWVAVDASAASGAAAGRVAIVLQAATPASLAPLIAAAHGLTRRERELTELVLQGCGTAEIAAALFVSPLTVQGHLQTIFAKVGVRSRRELVGTVFMRHYRPRVVAIGCDET
jgi:DNA-binding CsgD family transcriptional regulator